MKKSKIIVLVLAIIAFIVDLIMVVLNKTEAIDSFFRNIIYSNVSEVVSTFMHNVTFLGSTPFIVGVCALVFFILIYKKRKKTAFSIAGILILSTILNNVIKVIVRRPRPLYISINEPTLSFPSGHMMASTTLYGFLIYMIIKSENISKFYKVIYICLLSLVILLVATSRIYLGAHYATDIIGGFLISFSLIITYSIINDYKKIFD